MAIEDYKLVAQRKVASNSTKLPKEWLLQPKYLENIGPDSPVNVLDVPRKSGILSEKELDITENHDATALLEKLASKQLTSYEVVLAFCKRAAVAQQLVNLLDHYLQVCELTAGKDQLPLGDILRRSARPRERM